MFVPKHHAHAVVIRALDLAEQGVPHAEIARSTGVPLHTVRLWAYGRVPHEVRVRREPGRWCEQCGGASHEFDSLPPEYGYLLGMYLGDGNIFGHSRRSFSLRVTMDVTYPGIVAETYAALTSIRGRPPRMRPVADAGCLQLVSYWRSWPCLLPQHGPGRKHTRRIRLAEWQRELVAADPRPFLRGLVHSDGWRGLNRVRVKGRGYAYPRYQFSNRSADIKRLFCWACELLAVEWRRWGRHHISVARRDSVAKLDEFIGPKR